MYKIACDAKCAFSPQTEIQTDTLKLIAYFEHSNLVSDFDSSNDFDSGWVCAVLCAPLISYSQNLVFNC